jgi:GTP cyclohydrolase II
MGTETTPAKHIRLTSHPVEGADGVIPIRWGRADPRERGAVIGSTSNRSQRNVIGTHSGSYGVYRALAVAAGALLRGHVPDLTNTMPTDPVGPYPAWGDPDKIVSMDPFGAVVADVFRDEIAKGYDIRPTIAMTKAHIDMPEVHRAMAAGRLVADGRILLANGSAVVNKAAIEPVWWLPGVAKRFKCSEADLRRALFEETGGMYPELVTRGDLDVFLPPIGGQTVYVFGDPKDLANPAVTLTARVHDECNGSDVFGSDICTCRPYLTHAIEECIRGAQNGGCRPRRVLPQGGPRPRRGDQVPRLQRAQAAGGRRFGDQLFPAYRMRCGRAGHALPGADAGRAALARRAPHPSPGLDEQPEVRRDRRRRHRGRRARQDSRRPDPR